MSKIEHQIALNRFVLIIDGATAKIDYTLKDGKMYLVYSEIPETLRGQGVGKKLVLDTFEKLTTDGYKAVAVCGYIKAIAQRSEKWKDIISF